MATSYSTNLALALPATGELSGTWGTTVNSNITNMLDEALGYQAFTATGGSDTLTIPDGTTGVARSIYIQLNGTGGGTVNVPATKTKMYFVFNNTASAITFKVTGQTGVAIPAAAKIALVSNGTDIITAENYLTALTLGAALPVASGGTGTTSTTFTNLTTNVTGTLPIANGGTGTTSTTFVNLATNVTGTLPIANGGTGTTSTTFVNLATNVTGDLPVTNLNAGTSASATTFWRGDGAWGIPSGTGGTVTSVAATVPSIFSIAGSPITTSGTLAMTYSGTALPVANGGTGQTTYTDGQLLIGNTTGNTLTKTTLTAGAGVTITNASGSITVATTGAGTVWVTKTTAYTAVNGDYMFCDTSSAAFTITLPASPTINNTVYFQDAKGTFNINALSIDPGANSIMGSSGNLVSTLLNAGFGLFFNGTEWRIF